MSTSPATNIPLSIRASYQEMNRLRLRAVEVRLTLMAALRSITAQREAEGDRLTASNAADLTVVQNQLNAMTIISFFGTLEGYVEALSQALIQPVVNHRDQCDKELKKRIRRIISQQSKEAHASGTPITEETRRGLIHAVLQVVNDFRPAPPVERLSKGLPAVGRWEDALKRVGLGETSDRPLPSDLRDTLNELGEIRNVLLHRMGRLDRAALDAVREGPWRNIDEEVIIDPPLYRRYVAAIWSFTDEIGQRFIIKLGAAASFDINSWRGNVPMGG